MEKRIPDAGRLRHKVALLKFNDTLGAYGDPRMDDPDNWVIAATVWAAIDPVAGREFYANEQAQTEISHKVTLRYRPDVRGGMRIGFGARMLDIEAVIDWEERHEFLLLMCKEVAR